METRKPNFRHKKLQNIRRSLKKKDKNQQERAEMRRAIISHSFAARASLH